MRLRIQPDCTQTNHSPAFNHNHHCKMTQLTREGLAQVYNSKVAGLAVDIDYRRPDWQTAPSRLSQGQIEEIELLDKELADLLRNKYGFAHLEPHQMGGQGAVLKAGRNYCVKVIPINEHRVVRNSIHTGLLEAGIERWLRATGRRLPIPEYDQILLCTPELMQELMHDEEYKKCCRNHSAPQLFVMMVMKFYEGGDLRQFLEQQQAALNGNGEWSVDMRFNSACMLQLLQGMVTLHDHRILYPDMKLANVLLTMEGGAVNLKICDITSCVLMGADGTGDFTTASVTPDFMDPLRVCAVCNRGIQRKDLPLDTDHDNATTGYTLSQLFFGSCLPRILGIGKHEVRRGEPITQAMFIWSTVGRASTNEAVAMMQCDYDMDGNLCDFESYKKKWQYHPILRYVCSTFGDDALYLLRVFYQYAVTGSMEQRRIQLAIVHAVIGMTIQPNNFNNKAVLTAFAPFLTALTLTGTVVNLPVYKEEEEEEHDVGVQTSLVGQPNPAPAVSKHNISLQTSLPAPAVTSAIHAAPVTAAMRVGGSMVGSDQALAYQHVHLNNTSSDSSDAEGVIAQQPHQLQLSSVLATQKGGHESGAVHQGADKGCASDLAGIPCGRPAPLQAAVSGDGAAASPDLQMVVQKPKPQDPLSVTAPVTPPATAGSPFTATTNQTGLLGNGNKQQQQQQRPQMSTLRKACHWVSSWIRTKNAAAPRCITPPQRRGLADLSINDDVRVLHIGDDKDDKQAELAMNP